MVIGRASERLAGLARPLVWAVYAAWVGSALVMSRWDQSWPWSRNWTYGAAISGMYFVDALAALAVVGVERRRGDDAFTWGWAILFCGCGGQAAVVSP